MICCTCKKVLVSQGMFASSAVLRYMVSLLCNAQALAKLSDSFCCCRQPDLNIVNELVPVVHCIHFQQRDCRNSLVVLVLVNHLKELQLRKLIH